MRKFKLKGTHILADLYKCDFLHIQSKTPSEIQEQISKIIAGNNLLELGNYYHFFQAPISFTAVISLAESHVSVHTWPEDKYVSIDVFVCNYLSDQSARAIKVCEEISEMFNPGKQRKRIIQRQRFPLD